MTNVDNTADDFTYFCGLVSLLIMSADGNLDKTEIEQLEKAFKKNATLAKSDSNLELMEIHSFLAADRGINAEKTLSDLALDDDMKKQGLEIGLVVALADGKFTEEEKQRLLKIVVITGVGQSFGAELVQKGEKLIAN